MPNLTLFAPCDNVLIAKDHESLSLITILTQVMYPQPPEGLPENAIGPMRWFFVTNWISNPEDIGFNFEQRLRMLMGEISYIGADQVFSCPEGKLHNRIITGFNTFPLVPPGTYQFEVAIRPQGTEEWRIAGMYPLLVGHLTEVL
jgi:hypothetical protein